MTLCLRNCLKFKNKGRVCAKWVGVVFITPVTSHWTCGHLWPMDPGFLSHVKPGTFESELKTVDSHTWRCCCLAVNVVTRKNILRSKGFFKWNTTHENHSCGANPDEESSTWITLFASVRICSQLLSQWLRTAALRGSRVGCLTCRCLIMFPRPVPLLGRGWGHRWSWQNLHHDKGHERSMGNCDILWPSTNLAKKKDLLIRFITFWNNLILQQNVSACPVPCPIAVSRVSDSACSMASSLASSQASSLASSVVSSPPSSRVSCMGLSFREKWCPPGVHHLGISAFQPEFNCLISLPMADFRFPSFLLPAKVTPFMNSS